MTVHVSYLTLPGEKRIGILTLDAPASLNALNLPMIQILQQTLTRLGAGSRHRLCAAAGGG